MKILCNCSSAYVSNTMIYFQPSSLEHSFFFNFMRKGSRLAGWLVWKGKKRGIMILLSCADKVKKCYCCRACTSELLVVSGCVYVAWIAIFFLVLLLLFIFFWNYQLFAYNAYLVSVKFYFSDILFYFFFYLASFMSLN